MSDSIKVAIKVRPLIKREKEDNLPIQWTVHNGNSIVSTDAEMKKRGDGGFCFDHIFDMNASNLDVFDTIVKPIVNAGVNGINGTVFAYGQTSSGKTYTMMGTAQEPGIIPLAIEHMFDAIANTAGREFLLRVSYLEIYNERVNDLLNKGATDLKLKEDGSGQVVLQCKEEITNSPENVLSIMKKGDKNRRIGETNMNERSSRSHTIFRITIESREAGGDSDGAIQVSQLNLVDLAGSERARQTGATGERFKEGRHINMSLTTLGLVIMQLSESQDGQKHVNFRDSKLTRLLQSSLGGNAMTAIICAVTPAALEETQCTLSFASRAKSVKNKPQINEVMSDGALLKRYAKQLTKLQQELERIKNENRAAEVEEMESKLQEKDRINQLLEERIELLKTRIVSGDNTGQEQSFKSKSKRRQTWGGPGMFSQHIPVFQPESGLPTIKEVSFEKPHRKSVIQSVDIMNQTFQTAFADFELELFESERDRDSRENASDSEEEPFVARFKNRVTFRDDVTTIKSKNSSFEGTPEKCSTGTQTSQQISPSTPKHVLRRCISELTRQFVELREFTTLEKQMICEEHRCSAQHEEKEEEKNEEAAVTSEQETEYTPDVKMRLANLNLGEEKNLERVIAELCLKLHEAEEQMAMEKEASSKTMKHLAEMEKRVENITSERNEFEYISRELRAELKKKTAELELRNMSEESLKQEELRRIHELEAQNKNIQLERNNFERANAEARKRIACLQKEMENIASERIEFEHMRRELHMELNKKDLELQQLREGFGTQETDGRIKELEKQIENIVAEKNAMESLCAELRNDLTRTSTEFELKIAVERTEREKAVGKFVELEKRVEQVTVERDRYRQASEEAAKEIQNLELKIQSGQCNGQESKAKVSELEKQIESLELRIESEQTKSLESEVKVSELEKQIESLELRIESEQTKSQESVAKVSELEKQIESLELRIESEQTKSQESVAKVAELEKQVESLELRIESEQTKSQESVAKVSELEKQIESLELRIESEQTKSQESVAKVAELEKQVESLELRIESEQTKSQESVAKVSELEKQIESLELRIESEQTKSQESEAKVAELEKQIECLELKTGAEQTKSQESEAKVSELEKQIESLELKIESEQTKSQGSEAKVAELEKQIESLELRMESEQTKSQESEAKVAELEKQIECLELKIESERAVSEKAMDKISGLEKQIESIASEKMELERLNDELNNNVSELKSTIISQQTPREQAMEKMAGLEKGMENQAKEKENSQRINMELQAKLDQEASEAETVLTSEQTENQISKETDSCDLSAVEKISELEQRIAKMISEKIELERMNKELHAKLNEKTSALKAKITSETMERQEIMAMVGDLEVEIGNMICAKDEYESVIAELRAELEERTAELEAEQAEHERAVVGMANLTERIRALTIERDEAQRVRYRLSAELNERAAESEASTISEQTAHQEAEERVFELQKSDEDVANEGNRTIIEFDEEFVANNNEAGARNEQDSDSKMAERNEYDNTDGIELRNLRKYVTDLEDVVANLRAENRDLKDQLGNQSLPFCSRLDESNADASYLLLNMEAEKSLLEENLQLKSQELDDIKNDVRSLKTDIKKLQETIYLLTTENMEMATKLSTEQENARTTELNLQRTIDELYARISAVTSEKIALEGDAACLSEQLESLRSKMAAAASEPERALPSIQIKIDQLTAENIELSALIAERNKELENIRESKSLLYDHECIYKEKLGALTEKNECLLAENSELSTDLIDKIEENDMLREQCDILKSKVEQSLVSSEKAADSDVERFRMENATLQTEIAELKTKLAILSEENAKFSGDLFETMENLDCSRAVQSSGEAPRAASGDGAENPVAERAISPVEGSERSPPSDEVEMLRSKVEHLTILNKKLSDLKLTSCSQCAHLRNLNESRRAMKLEAKILNRKLEDLQRKFDRKCADSENLNGSKFGQDLDSSVHDFSLNVSFVGDANVSFIEEKIQNLNDELQTLKADHDKLSALYDDKCNEVEQLRSASLDGADSNVPARKSSGGHGNRMEQIQKYVDQLRNEMDEMKRSGTNFAAMLNECRNEKSSLLEEISRLKEANEELRQVASCEQSTKIQILENELNNMARQAEDFSAREKEWESQKLMLEVELEQLRSDVRNRESTIAQLNAHLASLKDELRSVTSQRDEWQKGARSGDRESAELQRRLEELSDAHARSKELERHATVRIHELESCVAELQRNVTDRENVCRELREKGIYVEKLLQEREQERCMLAQKLQAAESEMVGYKNNLESKYKTEFDAMYQQYQRHLQEAESNVRHLNEAVQKYAEENSSLKQQLSNLRALEQRCGEMMNEKELASGDYTRLADANEKLGDELRDLRRCMINELASLKYDAKSADLACKPLTEIFAILLQTLVAKEGEVIRSVRETCEKERRKMEEEKRQCIDTEKRATLWSKELEAEIEKLQAEATEREQAQKECRERIAQLEHQLRECSHEREMFKEKMEAMEMDFANLQAEYEKRCSLDTRQEEAAVVAQRREREAREKFQSREMELRSRLGQEREAYERKVNELAHAVDTYKTKIVELNGTIEGLEANEKQLRNIIEANSSELRRREQNAERQNAELEQLTQSYNELSRETETKNSHIAEITAILKSKCDALAEYKSKLESILPDYEMLKEHAGQHKSVIERCRDEIETLKKEREEQLLAIQDRLSSEEIKNAGLTKQLQELSNRNVVLIDELNTLKESYEELREANARLERRIRNSTSKIKAEAEIEELKETNRRLQNNLDGASNRVTELQELKNQTLKEFVELKGRYEFLQQENNELKRSLAAEVSKRASSSFLLDESKYDAIVQEKNKVALELEGMKVILERRERELEERDSQIRQLTEKNKELDEEAEEYAATVRERDVEISKLEDKLYSRLTENVLLNEAEEKLKRIGEENDHLRDQLEALRMRVEMEAEEDARSRNESVVRALERENLELRATLGEYKKRAGTKMADGSTASADKKIEENFATARDRIGQLEAERDRIASEMAAQRALLSQKDKQLTECANKLREATARCMELENELKDRAQAIRSRDTEISRLKNSLYSQSTESLSSDDARQLLKFYATENTRLKNEIRELHMRSRIDGYHERSILKETTGKLQKCPPFDKDHKECEERCEQLKKTIHELELQLVSKNGKIATLEIQIQSENFPYQRKCKELEELVLAFRNKNAELSTEVRKLQRTVNDVNAWECDICRRWRVNRKDQACQTIPNTMMRLCSTSSGIVEDHVKIQKLEKEKTLMKDLCRARSRRVKELENRVKELEEAQSSPATQSNEGLLRASSQQYSNIGSCSNKHFDVGISSRS